MAVILIVQQVDKQAKGLPVWKAITIVYGRLLHQRDKTSCQPLVVLQNLNLNLAQFIFMYLSIIYFNPT